MVSAVGVGGGRSMLEGSEGVVVAGRVMSVVLVAVLKEKTEGLSRDLLDLLPGMAGD